MPKTKDRLIGAVGVAAGAAALGSAAGGDTDGPKAGLSKARKKLLTPRNAVAAAAVLTAFLYGRRAARRAAR
ncbi:hypothetical protein [Dactylosporangium salmoneum]|uniref:Uncharacterized protein n=1 Tax=Dactylosporangium salmoneum TaxID=53361 RepID=A0ABP5SKM8_9ACTN